MHLNLNIARKYLGLFCLKLEIERKWITDNLEWYKHVWHCTQTPEMPVSQQTSTSEQQHYFSSNDLRTAKYQWTEMTDYSASHVKLLTVCTSVLMAAGDRDRVSFTIFLKQLESSHVFCTQLNATVTAINIPNRYIHVTSNTFTTWLFVIAASCLKTQPRTCEKHK